MRSHVTLLTSNEVKCTTEMGLVLPYFLLSPPCADVTAPGLDAVFFPPTTCFSLKYWDCRPFHHSHAWIFKKLVVFCNPGWPQTSVASGQAPDRPALLPECWDCQQVPSHQALRFLVALGITPRALPLSYLFSFKTTLELLIYLFC